MVSDRGCGSHARRGSRGDDSIPHAASVIRVGGRVGDWLPSGNEWPERIDRFGHSLVRSALTAAAAPAVRGRGRDRGDGEQSGDEENGGVHDGP